MKTTRRVLRKALLGTIALALWGFGDVARSGQAAPGNPEAELKTAITHAGYSAKADALKGVTTHLHHTLNCLVGPADPRFDAAPGNPCKGQGNGFLPDLKATKGETEQYHEVWWVAAIADQALKTENLGQTKAAARIATVVLQDAEKMK